MKKPQATLNASYDVGYGKPPKANQFRKGQRKRGGKKRGEENLISAFKRHVQRRVKLNDGDKIRTITLAEAVILKNYNAALQKNPFAMSNMFRLAEASGEFVDRTDPKQVGRPLCVPEKVTMEEFLARHGRKLGE
jgi:hypothetical protein